MAQKRRGRGEGSVYLRKDGRWCASMVLPNGKRKSVYGNTRADAQRILVRLQADLQRGILPVPERQTLTHYLKEWLTQQSSRLKPSTLSSYATMCANHVIPCVGNYRLAQLNPQHVQRMLNNLADSGLSARSVQYTHSILRKALNDAVKLELIYRNPAAAVPPPRTVRREMKVLSESQVEELLDAVIRHDKRYGTRWYPLYLLAVSTGMRCGELLGLCWPCLDWQKSTITVSRALDSLKSKRLVPTKTNRVRVIPISSEVLRTLREHRQSQRVQSHMGLVFTTASGLPISRHNLNRQFHVVCEANGLPSLPFHALRHTFGTRLMERGVPLKVASDLLGHATISTTADIYQHTDIDSMREAIDMLSDKLSGESRRHVYGKSRLPRS